MRIDHHNPIGIRTAKPSLRDVAELAGVSLSTVSSVLTEREGARIGEDTRRRVRESADRLGYQPNNIARALASGRTYTLGVLVSRMVNFHSDTMLASACNLARERGYQFQLAFYQHYAPDSIDAAIGDLLRHNLDGILSIAAHSGDDPDITKAISNTGLAFSMAYYGAPDRANADCVLVDQRQGGYLATEHLIRRGRKRIVYAGGSEQTPVVNARIDGMRAALREYELPVLEPVLSGIYAAGGLAAVRELYARENEPPDAIVGFDDEVASGVLRGLHRRGLSVPGDISVIGFNDFEAICDACDPPLTSIRMPMSQVGHLSAQLLIDRLEGGATWRPQVVALPCTLVQRESA